MIATEEDLRYVEEQSSDKNDSNCRHGGDNLQLQEEYKRKQENSPSNTTTSLSVNAVDLTEANPKSTINRTEVDFNSPEYFSVEDMDKCFADKSMD